MKTRVDRASRPIRSQVHTRLAALFFLITLVLGGCAPLREQVIYPDQISPLGEPTPAGLADNTITVSVRASVDEVWRALALVLSQHALITHVRQGPDGRRSISYVDRSALLLENKPEVVEMPFQVTVEGKQDGHSLMTVVCRWDLITSKRYLSVKKQRFEDLKKGMLTEALILANRVDVQSTGAHRWQWLRKAGSI
jgi:hypothetical protein